MNKKLFLGMIATTGLLFATSCSSEDLIETTSGENVNVSFTVNADSSVGSRAVADGMTAKKLYFAVFDSITGSHQCGKLNMENGVANVKLTLAKNNTYSIAFWAQAEDAPYTFDNLTGKVTIDYEGSNNAENRDAFYANRKYTVKGDINETVTLYRPFAQINVGTTIDDYNNVFPTYDYVKSSVILNGEFGTEFNVLTGEVTATTSTPINYEVADAPTAADNNLRVANKDYEYISTCYVLPASSTESQTVKAEFKFDLSPMMSVELSQGLDMLPIQSNYRTNIVGDILTANAEWNVVIDKEFKGEYNNIAESNEPAVSADGTTYYVSTPAQWNWMVANNGQAKQVTKNVTLMADLDFQGGKVTPLYPVVANFVLDGNGKTIKNAEYEFVDGLNTYRKGLITLEGYVENSNLTVKNLTLEGIVASNKSSNDNEHGYSSALISDVQNKTNVTIDGVNVYSSEICGIQSIGALVGLIPAGSTATIKNSTVKGNTLSNSKIANESGYVCGLVGKVAGTLNVESTVNVDNNYINAYFALNRGPKSIDAVAAVKNNGVINSEANVVNNNRIYKQPIVEADLTISTKDELIAFAENYSAYNYKTVALVNDIDLDGVNWNPIGGPGADQDDPFNGTFEGCGFTISNLTVTEKDDAGVFDAIGFFGWLQGTIKNVNFETATINGHHDVAVVVGYLSDGLVENCNVNHATVKATYKDVDRDGDKAAVLVGYINNGAVKNCTIKNSTVEAVRDAGQGVGACTDAIRANLTGNTVEGVTVTGTGENISEEFVGRIVED